MRKPCIVMLGLAALIALACGTAGWSDAQGPPQRGGGKLPGPITDPLKAKKLDGLPDPITDPSKVKKGPSIQPQPKGLDKAKKVDFGLGIKSFQATRGQRDISLEGAIENVSLQPINGATYSMFKRTDTGWVRIKTGSVTLAPRKTIYVNAPDSHTNAMVVYKLEVAGGGQTDVREFVLSERKLSYLVKYDTKGAKLLARYYPTTEETRVKGPRGWSLPGETPKRLQGQLNEVGFRAPMTTKRHEHPFSDWEFEFWVYAVTDTPQQRTFDNWRAAVDFRDHVRSLVPDKGLSIEIVER